MAASYQLYLTYRTEYLLLGDLCVGVRDRRTSEWLPLHAAACSQMIGALAKQHDSSLLPGTRARVGERLCLHVSPRRLITEPVMAVEKPTASVLKHAEEQWHSLFAPPDANQSKLVLVTESGAEAAFTSPKSR